MSALDHVRAHPDLFRHQGSVLAGWRTYRGHRLGPYYRLAWRENGRQRSIYLGPEGPLVAEVRQALADLQRPHREDVTIRKLWREGWRQFRLTRLQLAVQLAMHGLQLKGSEIRGWRSLYPPSSRPPFPGLGFPRCCSYRVHVPRIIPDTVVRVLQSGSLNFGLHHSLFDIHHSPPVARRPNNEQGSPNVEVNSGSRRPPQELSRFSDNRPPVTDNPAVLHSSVNFGLHHSLFDIHHSPPAARRPNNEQGSPNVEVNSGSRRPPQSLRRSTTENRQPTTAAPGWRGSYKIGPGENC